MAITVIKPRCTIVSSQFVKQIRRLLNKFVHFKNWMMLFGEHSRNNTLRDSVWKKIAFSILSSLHTPWADVQ